MIAFRILYQDEQLIVIDKPPGFHSHPPEDSKIRISPRWNCLHVLERQIGKRVYPAHRLDRATSGVLLFALQRELCAPLQKSFQEQKVKKRYCALVRGAFSKEAWLEAPLERENGSMVEATTYVRELIQFRFPIAGPKGNERDFTLLEAFPKTGRHHQIRRHLAGIATPIVGDTRHGDKKLNRNFTEYTGLNRLFLRAMELEFQHPVSEKKISLRAGWTRDWHMLFDKVGTCPITTTLPSLKRP